MITDRADHDEAIGVIMMAEMRRCGEARVAAILNTLRCFLRFCREVLRLGALDPRQIRVPRIPRRDVLYLTKEEVDRFFTAIIGPGERWEEIPLARLRFRAPGGGAPRPAGQEVTSRQLAG